MVVALIMSLKKNVIGLALAQIFSYIVPLIQLPYLSRVLGGDYFGLIIYTMSMTQMAMIFTDFGFDLSLSKKIAEGNAKKRKLGVYLSQASVIKTFVTLLSCLGIFLIALLSKHFSSWEYILFMILTVIFNGFNPRWLFQGLEKSYIYSWIVIISRCISLIAIYLFITKKDDYILFPIIMALQGFLLTTICFYIIKKWGIKHEPVRNRKIILQFWESLEFFLSRVGVAVYSTGSSLFLGTFSSNLHQVAIYGVAEQLYKAGTQVFFPVITALTPYMVRTKNYKLFFKICIGAIIIALCGSFIGWFFGSYIIHLIFGPGFEDAKHVLNIFMFVIIGSIMGMLFGYPALMPLGKSRHANLSVLYSGFVQIFLLISMYIGYFPITAVSVSICYLICDWLMFIYRFVVFTKSYNLRKGC